MVDNTSSPAPYVLPPAEVDAFAAAVVLEVCEIPDRNSPDDQPDMLLVTADELHRIVVRLFERWREASR